MANYYISGLEGENVRRERKERVERMETGLIIVRRGVRRRNSRVSSGIVYFKIYWKSHPPHI